MGGSSSSKTSTSNVTDASTTSVNQGGALAGIVGSDNEVNLSILDGGAIESAFDFGENILDVNASVVESGFSFAGDSLNFADNALEKSFEFGSDSTDAAFAFSADIAERSSLENRQILNSAINASNDAQSSVLKFAQNVSTPQTQLIKAGVIGLSIFAVLSVVLKMKASA